MYIRNYINELISYAEQFNDCEMKKILDVFEKSRQGKKRIFVFGNGGSSSHANHFACDLGKNVTKSENERFHIISICENIAAITAYANDINYESIFSEQLKNYGITENDIILAISSSGNSPNVIKACDYAKSKGAIILSLTGFDGGKLKKMSDVSLHIPCNEYEKVEDLHMVALHIIVSYFKNNGSESGKDE